MITGIRGPVLCGLLILFASMQGDVLGANAGSALAQEPLTEAHAVQRTAPLYRIITGRSDGFKVSTDLLAAYSSGGRSVRSLWSIVCTAPGDQVEVRFLWDADHARLLSVSRIGLGASRDLPLLSREAAIGIAQVWLKNLALAKPESRSKAHAVATMTRNSWIVSWKSAAGSSRLHIDARTGELLSAQ